MKRRLLLLFSVLLLSALTYRMSQGSSSSEHCVFTEQRLGDDKFWVQVGRYGVASKKTLLIIPPTGGETLIDRSYAKMFCNSGYEVFILQEWAEQNEKSIELTVHQRFYERSQKAIALILLETKSDYIGLLGTSVGALHSAVAASVQPRIDAVFIITGGAPLASVIVNSDQDAMRWLFDERMRAFGFKSVTEYQAALSTALKLEPMQLGDAFKNKKIGAVVALNDTKVPTETQQNLINYWKPQLVISKDYGHFGAIVSTWLQNSDEILDFFNSSFSKK